MSLTVGQLTEILGAMRGLSDALDLPNNLVSTDVMRTALTRVLEGHKTKTLCEAHHRLVNAVQLLADTETTIGKR